MKTKEIKQETLNGKDTLADIVLENYHAANVFLENDLDFYCRGDQTLDEACNFAGMNTDKLIQKLEALPKSERTKSEDVRGWSIHFLADFIESTHHKYVRIKNKKLSKYAAILCQNHKEFSSELTAIYEHFLLLIQEVDRHMCEEENRIFPLIKELAYEVNSTGSADSQTISVFRDEIEKLRDEHETAVKMMKELRKVSNDFKPSEGASDEICKLYRNLTDFEQDLYRHIHLESNVLFKKAEALI